MILISAAAAVYCGLILVPATSVITILSFVTMPCDIYFETAENDRSRDVDGQYELVGA